MDDSEATINDDAFSFGEDAIQSERQILSYAELLARVTTLMQSCEGCENVTVVGVDPLDRPDTAGCNWSFTLVLDAAGVAADVLAYAQVIGMARSAWNLR
jgi:hypothetical protein